MNTWPQTVIIVHRKEKPSKCTLQPLRGRADMTFHSFPLFSPIELPNYVRLAVDAPILSPDDADRGLLLLDASWKHVEAMNEAFINVPARSLPPIKTAYPRVSSLYEDPSAGLASIEALYVAYRQLGRDTDGLLDAYHWRNEFLDINGFA